MDGDAAVIGSVPAHRIKNPAEFVPATPFAGPYRSHLTDLSLEYSPDLLRSLPHVNCSYLSSKDYIPTLEQLKQHAQSLTILIRELSVSSQAGLIDNQNIKIPDEHGELMPIKSFKQDETFDWLNDLRNSYSNDQIHHKLPLTSVTNTIEADDRGIRDICPLDSTLKSEPNMPSQPWATHQNLIKHANEVLELIDHEYGAKGGLLGILHTNVGDEEQREFAETTLLGQMILFIQHLIHRVSELERLYANACDLIADQAVIPSQTLSRLGADGRQGREQVYPQDRFILANAGQDVWEYLSREFDKQEADQEAIRRQNFRDGVTADDRAFDPGVNILDVNTRYFRLKSTVDDAKKTIFIIPAYQRHPNTEVTREQEKAPLVISAVKPVNPERASLWELRNRDKLYTTQMQNDFVKAQNEVEQLRHSNEAMKFDRRTLLGQIEEKDKYIDAMAKDPKYAMDNVTRERNFLRGQRAQLEKDQASLKKAQKDIKDRAEAFDFQLARVQTESDTFQSQATQLRKKLKDSEQSLQREVADLKLQLRTEADTHATLISTYTAQIDSLTKRLEATTKDPQTAASF
ncbi:hypothetical protein BP5796_05164 [Coleophoma crateriformis]|uniref:Uncharacterized protein n=1 Tax=Coleophoma crateriformis TaxID=565419 RepID=A0A3D8S2H1_9HELO|nr:hypothetical protein BP5796_05164 [Coleophoma crateriformis]